MLYAPMTIEQAEVAWFAAYVAYFEARLSQDMDAAYQRMQAVKAAYPGVVPSYSWAAA